MVMVRTRRRCVADEELARISGVTAWSLSISAGDEARREGWLAGSGRSQPIESTDELSGRSARSNPGRTTASPNPRGGRDGGAAVPAHGSDRPYAALMHALVLRQLTKVYKNGIKAPKAKPTQLHPV